MRKWFGFTLGIIGIILGLSSLYLEIDYGLTRPRSPQSLENRVIPMSDHGTVVFLTKQEDASLWGLRIGAVILVVCGGILEICTRKKGNKGGE